VKLIFTDQYANLFLLINGLALIFYLGAKKKKRQRAMRFGNYETLQKVAGKNFLKSSNIILVTRMMALTALIIGISQPVLVDEQPSTGTDYVVTIDSSSSMLASDLKPTRFQAAKRVSQDFVDQLSNQTNIGVVSFSGEVKQENKLSSRKEEVKAGIEQINTGTTAGTAIGDAVYSSVSMLLQSNNSRTVMLVTDGRNNVGTSINESTDFATSHNVTVNTIAIGEKKNSSQEFGTVNGFNASKAAYPNLDTESLYRLSNRTGGELVTVSENTDLKDAFLEFERTETRTDISRYFIFLAAGLLLLEWVLGTTRYSILP